jgi:hypothetical protein
MLNLHHGYFENPIYPKHKGDMNLPKTSRYIKLVWILLSFLLILFSPAKPLNALTREKLPVKFLEYDDRPFILAKKKNKPVFILISAEWCHWCTLFEENTLQNEKVYSFLNNNFINIFVDADIRRDIYLKYHATALPYVVFLNPDGSVLYKYGGTLQAKDFLGLIKSIQNKTFASQTSESALKSVLSSYSPPSKLLKKNISALRSVFLETFSENFDMEEFGIGGYKKFLLPQTFLYLYEHGENNNAEHLNMIDATLKKAVEKIYDPVEGGFFRYAEKRDWGIPHYEKMLDVNSAALLLLLKANAARPSSEFRDPIRKTVDYLSSKLYHENKGVFMSSQIADTTYYRLSSKKRKTAVEPAVVKKLFTDSFSISMAYCLDSLNLLKDINFEHKVKKAVGFFAGKVEKQDSIFHYYSIHEDKWDSPGTLADYVYTALLFSKAYKKFGNRKYLRLAKKTLKKTRQTFYNKRHKIYIDKSFKIPEDLENLMELNAVVALAWLNISNIKDNKKLQKEIDNALAYFSGMSEIFLEKAWATKDYRFLEAYASYLYTVERFLSLNTDT